MQRIAIEAMQYATHENCLKFFTFLSIVVHIATQDGRDCANL